MTQRNEGGVRVERVVRRQPSVLLYLTLLEDLCRKNNLPTPLGLVLADGVFDEFRKWAVHYLNAEHCMLESGNLVVWNGMELRRQHPIYPPKD